MTGQDKIHKSEAGGGEAYEHREKKKEKKKKKYKGHTQCLHSENEKLCIKCNTLQQWYKP